jgi:hypothetical protein
MSITENGDFFASRKTMRWKMNVKKGMYAGYRVLLNFYKGLLRLQPYNLNPKKIGLPYNSRKPDCKKKK